MLISTYQQITRSQMLAALAMLEECINRCPAEHWAMPVAKYPFWQVAYHTLCFVDCYLSPSSESFKELVAARSSQPFNPQPRGMSELNDEYPSRLFSKEELLAYCANCREKIDSVLTSETDATLGGPSGFSWLPFTRAEVHLYNLRHIQHHAGQLSAALRRVGVDTRWVKAG